MRRTLLFITALLLIATQAESRARQLAGSWKEVHRTDLDGRPLNYRDTFFIKFNEGADQYTYRAGDWNGGIIGHPVDYIREGDMVYNRDGYSKDTKDDSYLFTILDYNNNSLVLRNKKYIREFAWFKDVGEDLPRESESVAVPDISVMKGHWSEFKRTSERKEAIDYTKLIKFMDIFSTFKDGNFGYIYATRDADNNPSWRIDSYDGRSQVLHCSLMNPNSKKVYARELRVLRCEDNELRLEEDGIVYYFRKFKMFD